jgi:hypothetical protein
VVRIIQEQWLTAGYSIEFGEQQRMTPEGLPSMTPEGIPEMEKVTVLVLVRQNNNEQHQLRVPFGEAQKQKLISDLAGGIVLPGSTDMSQFKL